MSTLLLATCSVQAFHQYGSELLECPIQKCFVLVDGSVDQVTKFLTFLTCQMTCLIAQCEILLCYSTDFVVRRLPYWAIPRQDLVFPKQNYAVCFQVFLLLLYLLSAVVSVGRCPGWRQHYPSCRDRAREKDQTQCLVAKMSSFAHCSIWLNENAQSQEALSCLLNFAIDDDLATRPNCWTHDANQAYQLH
jgi:hypothetical protein